MPAFLKRIHAAELLCLVIIGFAVYSGTLNHSFHFDDDDNIIYNSAIHITELSIAGLRKAATDSFLKHRPVPYISFALNYYLHGLDVWGFHVVNILIHLSTGVLLFFFVKTTLNLPAVRIKRDVVAYIPFATALLWLVHPLHTQSVTYIIQRMNSMGAMFFLMAMLCYAHARQANGRLAGLVLFLAAAATTLLALGCKENMVMLPVFILVYEWYFFQDLKSTTSRNIIALAALGILFTAGLFFFLGPDPWAKLAAGYDKRSFTLAQRLLTEPRAILLYLSLLLYPNPNRLTLDYYFPLSYSLLDPPSALLSLAALATMLLFAAGLARNHRLLSFCILWFLGNLAVESTIIPLELVFEHRTYLPSMTAVLAAVLLLRRFAPNTKMFMAIVIAVSLVLSYWTVERNTIWKDRLTLLTDTLHKSPDKARTHFNLGRAYGNAGDHRQALFYFNKALELYKRDVRLYNKEDSNLTFFLLWNIGLSHRNLSEYGQAVRAFTLASEKSSPGAGLHFQLGYCYYQLKQLDKAVLHLTKARLYSGQQAGRPYTRVNGELIAIYLDKSQSLLDAVEAGRQPSLH